MKVAYRLFRKGDRPATLFHGLDGSRTLPTDVWIDAEVKLVWNPGKNNNGPGYMSGFHVGFDRDEIVEYTKRFKNPDDLVVCKIYVDKVRPKPRATSNIHLAECMLIKEEDWREALGGK